MREHDRYTQIGSIRMESGTIAYSSEALKGFRLQRPHMVWNRDELTFLFYVLSSLSDLLSLSFVAFSSLPFVIASFIHNIRR
jgi:hypothetical protein